MSGSLAFSYFPAGQWRPSGVNIEFDASQANSAVQNQRALLIGQKLAGGTATADVPVQAINQAQVNGLCGAGSMLAAEYATYRKADPYGEVWLGPVADNGAGVVATGTVVFSGTATAPGTVPLYIMGVSIPVAVATGDTASVVGTNVAAAITAAGLPIAAVPTAGSVALTTLHKGLAQNDFDIQFAYQGVQNGEAMPAGITAVITPLSGGTTNPVLTTLLANLGVQLFDFIALPYTDATSLDALKNFLSDSSGRWSATEMQYGHVFSAYRGTVSARGSFGTGRNDQHCSILGFYASPTPAWLEAADWCAVHAVALRVNPAIGLTGRVLGLLPPPVLAQDDPGERNLLLYDGISTFTVGADGTCRIDRSITTYQKNASGFPDNAYLATNLLFQAAYAGRYIAAQLTSQFIDSGKILVANGTPIGPGSPAVTPDAILGAVFAMYAYLSSIFVTQNPETFAANATASIGARGQVLLYLPIDFSDQVVAIAILAQFRQST